MYGQFAEAVASILDRFKHGLFQIIPNLVVALIILAAGLLLAYIVKAIGERFINSLPHLIPSRKIQGRLKHFISEKPVSRVIGSILYWIIIFFFITVATETMGLPVITAWLSGIVNYFPRILAAVLIGLTGIIGGLIVRDIIATSASSVGVAYGNFLGKLSQAAIILVTVLIAIEQMGIDVAFLTDVISIVLAALLFGAALAFGLGAKTSVSNILASHYLQKTYRVGHTLRIGEITGQVTAITPVAVILDTAEGQVSIPAKDFSEAASVLIAEES